MIVENKKIVIDGKPFIIAEVSQNHDGSLGQAHAFIDAVAETGADAIKFQTHIASQESTPLEKFRVNFSYEDKSRYDYWKRMEFTEEQWQELYNHAKSRGLIFLSSPFSLKALELLDRIGVPAWKFGAGEVFNLPLLRCACKTGKPIILSTGLSTYDDIEQQLAITDKENVALLQCVTAYPSTPDQININLIPKLIEKYQIPVGISDHSATIYPALAAIALGASIVEVHVTMSKYMFGPDVKASVTIEQLKEIVKGSQFIYRMRCNTNDLLNYSNEQEKLKVLFSKSLYYTRDLDPGHSIVPDDLIAKKPGAGERPEQQHLYVGRILKKHVKEDDLLTTDDFV